MLREAVVHVFRRIARIYFREIEIVGAPPSDTRGRLFGANHVNALVDPIVILTSLGCEVSPIAKSTLFSIPGLNVLLAIADAVPVLRKKDDPTLPAGSNEQVFDRVASHLQRGGNILIFPEGTSHNEPHVLDLKTGAGRMLARGRENGARGLEFQAVALEFDARDRFRSRALVVFGPARSVDELAATTDDLPRAITDVLRDDLAELVVEGETWADRLLVGRVAEVLANESGDRTLAGWNAIGRQVEAARKRLHDDDAVYEDVARAVGRYYAMLDEAGVRDATVLSGGHAPGRLVRGGWLAVLAPLAALGALLYCVPYQLPRLAHDLAKGEADVVSTYKLGIGLVAYPVWAALLVALALVWVSPPWSVAAAALALVSPLAALPWLDFRDRRRGRRWVSGTGVPTREELAAARRDAMEAISRAREHVERVAAAS